MLNKWLANAKSKQNLLSASRSGIWQFRDIPIFNFIEGVKQATMEHRLLMVFQVSDVEDYDIDLIDDAAYWHFEVCWNNKPKKSYHQVVCIGDWAISEPDCEGLIFKYQP